METTTNTIARFMISVFYIADGFVLTNTLNPSDPEAFPFLSILIFSAGCVEILFGLILFLGHKKSASAILLVISTMLTSLLLYQGFFELLNDIALAAGLLLIINNNAGVTLWEYAQTDINDLPDYKVKM